MSRGLLDDSTLKSIGDKLPDVVGLQKIVLEIAPDFISTQFSHDSTVPIAAVCLQDAVHILTQARHALHEIYAHRIWYLESPNINEKAARYFTEYYAADIALRLYASAEHLASAIINMLRLGQRDIGKPKKRCRGTSLACAVGKYLARKIPEHPISQACIALVECKDWQKTIKYRNNWVHDQPPLVKGMGIVYERNMHWQDAADEEGRSTKVLVVGVGAEPTLTDIDLFHFTENALNEFFLTTKAVTAFYFDLLSRNGITVAPNPFPVSNL